MTNKNIFDFKDYRDFIADWIQNRPARGHGERSRMAQAMGCHIAYVSTVLGKKADFSLEQGLKLARYLSLQEDEEDFFLLLLQRERAGTHELQRVFDRKIEKALKSREDLAKRLKFTQELSGEDQMRYYSSWIPMAVHLLLSIPRFQDQKTAIEYLGIDERSYHETVDFLLKSGLVVRNGRRLDSGKFNMHLNAGSPMSTKHHFNWRLRAMHDIERNRPESLHYSSGVTIARVDAPRIREILFKAIEQVRSVVRESAPEDALYCYNLDLFEVR